MAAGVRVDSGSGYVMAGEAVLNRHLGDACTTRLGNSECPASNKVVNKIVDMSR